jgi:hypothetical protein
VSNSFTSCISNASEEFSRAPEMPCSEMVSQPRMFLHQLESRIPLKQLQCFADTYSGGHFNKQMDMVNCNMQLINFESIFESSLPDEKLAVHSDKLKFKWVSGIFGFPDKMEGILSEGMFKTLQIHFFSPKSAQENIAHANFFGLVREPSNKAHDIQAFQELNFNGGRIPPMFENMGILRQM